jgi:hypothetical protein
MKPIPFSTQMVQAILDGRKTQTRRVIKPNEMSFTVTGKNRSRILSVDGVGVYLAPYKPGDVLWVREAWRYVSFMFDFSAGVWTAQIQYKADDKVGNRIVCCKGEDSLIGWQSPVTMPRSAARLFLLVTDVWAERVQDISTADAFAEGALAVYCDCVREGRRIYGCGDCMNTGFQEPPQVDFMLEWNKRYAKRGHGWDKNDWVFAHTFERIEKPEGA